MISGERVDVGEGHDLYSLNNVKSKKHFAPYYNKPIYNYIGTRGRVFDVIRSMYNVVKSYVQVGTEKTPTN